MENKDEQIEEVAKILRDKCFYYLSDTSVEASEKIAEELLKYYQPKFPENSVIISMEDYTELKQAKTLLGFREETIGHLEDANIRYHNTLCDVFNDWIETDKETGGFNLPHIYELAKQVGVDLENAHL